MPANKSIFMLGTRFDTMGGVSSVVNIYRATRMIDRFSIIYIPTHCDGSPFAKLKLMLTAYVRFLSMLFVGRVGLLHVHTASRASFWRKSIFLLTAFVFGVPTILHLHGAEFHVFYEKECGNLRKRFIRYIFNKVNRVVVLSVTWKVWVQGISDNPHVEAIYNPVILPKIAYDWKARKRGTVLFLGRLGERKGCYDLLGAAAKVVTLHPELQLLLGGDGELKQVRSRAGELGVGNKVELLGWVKGADKELHLFNAMIYALPSYNEGLPMSLLEAMAAGLPILSTPIGGIPEAITDGVEGFLIEPGDIDGLADRLSRLLDDPDLAQRMGEAARRKVATTFSADVVLPQIEQLYIELGFTAT